MNIFPRQLFSIGFIAASLALCTLASGRDKWQEGETQRRADYIFMEAQRQNALENNPAYFELLNRAYQLDTSQTAVGHDLGYLLMMTADNDSAIFREGYDMMARHFNAHPDDYYGAMFYGAVNDRLRLTDESVRVWSALDSIFPNKPEISFKLAEALASTGDSSNIRKAIAVYDRLEEAEGKDVGLASRKIRSYYALGDTSSMRRELHQLLASSPKSSDYSIYAGELFAAMGNTDSALYYFNRACALDSTNGIAYLQRANLYRAMGDSAAFDREVFMALKQDNLDLQAKLSMFKGYIQELYSDTLQQPRINDLFGVLIEQNPHEVEVRDLYTAYLIAINDYRGAAEQTGYAIDIDPSNEERWSALVSLYMQADDYEKSVQEGERSLRYHPKSSVLHMITATGYSMLEDQTKAIEYFNRAYSLTDSTNNVMRSKIMGAMGDTYYNSEQKDSAFVYYEKAIQLDPGNMLAMNNCAYFLACEGRDLDRAEQLSAITVRDNPLNPTSLDTYAWVFFKKGDYAMARQYIDAAMANDPELSAEILHHAGDIYFMDGHPDEALDFWKQALKLDPDDELLSRKVKHKTFFYK